MSESEPRLRFVPLEEFIASERARVEALDVPAAIEALLAAIGELASHEARRLDVPSIDPTYHGCEPAWSKALLAAWDLREVSRRDGVLGAPPA